MSPPLVIRNLTIEIGGARAVDGVSLEVAEGRLLALVGESGSGKSLTALACVRLLPGAARVAGGDVLYRGKSVLALPRGELRALRGKEIAFVFQEPMTALHPTMTVGDQVAEAILVHERASKRDAWARAVALLDRVGIPEPACKAGSFPHELSGGQRQRVCIAMALAANPSVLIADEPTTALDPSLRGEILDLIDDLRRERGLAVLLISHDLDLVARRADEVAVLYSGRVVERGPAARVFSAPEHPYTAALLRSIAPVDVRLPRLEAIPGTVPPPWARPSGCRFRDRCSVVEDRCSATEPTLTPRRTPEHLAACVRP